VGQHGAGFGDPAVICLACQGGRHENCNGPELACPCDCGGTQSQLPGTSDTATREEMVTQQLHDWWVARNDESLQRTVPKAVRYGQASLELVGSALVTLLPKQYRSRKIALQMVCLFYAFGKLARAWAALLRGEDPSDDDYFDMEVYARMGRYVKEKGEWVG
jgi:hypothetical protein